ncbi:MAG: SAM-dependent methyltransferase [Leptothrix sp. (in: b-proteobacteria)]
MFTDLIAAPAAGTAPPPDDRARFLRLLDSALAARQFVRLVLSQYRGQDPELAHLDRLLVRAVTLRDAPHLQLVWRHATKDITKNLPLAAATELLHGLVAVEFGHAHLDTATQEVQLGMRLKGGAPRYRLQVGNKKVKAADPCASASTSASTSGATGSPAEPAPALAEADSHNRTKQRPLSLALPCWVDLGLATPARTLVPAMARKWKQINKFSEILASALAASPLAGASRVRVTDFGCGKGYLTFAMHALLSAHGQQAEVTGVELRPDLVELCNQAAQRHGHAGLRFDAGDIRSHPLQPMDVMVALHACDTATDFAIHLGLQAGAAIIMCSPCCHKQVRPQMTLPAVLRPLLQHGVHLGQEAEMVTDSLRALLLDAAGYDTQVFEFVALEHTNKNKMILAVKRGDQARVASGHADAVRRQIADIKAFYGIREQALESLLSGSII